MCNCKSCVESREFEARLAALPDEHRPYFEQVYENFMMTRAELNHAEAVIEGSWPSSDEIISGAREQVAERRAEQAISTARKHASAHLAALASTNGPATQ